MSFSSTDLNRYLDRFATTGRARQFIRDAAEGLSRDVGTAPGVSVIAEVQSQKMGVTTHTESQTGELAFAIHLEFDDHVSAFYEQLPPVDCLRTNKHGKKVRRAYRADFLVLKDTGPVVVQVKHAQRVEALLATKPEDWIEREGQTVDIPAELAFRELGLQHIVVKNTDLPQIRVSNLRTLLHIAPYAGNLDANLASRAEEILDQHAAMSIERLALALELKDLTPLLVMVKQKRIHALLDRQLLTQPDSCLVTRHPSLLKAAVEGICAHSFDMRTSCASTFKVPPKHDCEVALERLAALEQGATKRSARRWRKMVRNRPEMPPFQALLPRHAARGNRLPKRAHQVIELAMQMASKYWGSATRLTQENTYRLYQADAVALHPEEAPLSRTSFLKLIRHEAQRLAWERGGRRTGLAASAPSNIEDRAIPATRPFERASLDSCLCKVHCVLYVAKGVTYVTRPWLTALVDNHSGQPLAWWISFQRPSKSAIAMVLRDCVRRHGKLPESIICDWGSEHRSVYLSSVCANYQIELVFRPKQHSRFGAQVERFFGMLKSHWLDLRPGNRTDVKNIRNVSSTHHPSKYAVIDLPALMAELEDYTVWYSSEKFPTGIDTCSHLMSRGLEQFPHSGRPVTYDFDFIVRTAVDDKALAIDPARGIKYGDQHFWHPELNLLRSSRKKIEVRLEPEDYTQIYARIHANWVPCRSGRSLTFSAKDSLRMRAESLVVLEGRKLLTKAKQDADVALIKAIREADDRLKNASELSGSLFKAAEIPDEKDTSSHPIPDYWNDLNSTSPQELDVFSDKGVNHGR